MADEPIQLTPGTIMSGQEIDDLVSQFRLFNSRLSQPQMHKLFSELPNLTEADLAASGHQDDTCPICFNSFHSILAEEEVAHVMDSPAHPVDELGVTKLQNTCGHIFCRKDIIKWIKEGHDSCPSCRRPLVSVDDRRQLPQSDDSWMRPWLASDDMVARRIAVPVQLQLPTLSIDSIDNTRHQFTTSGMYS